MVHCGPSTCGPCIAGAVLVGVFNVAGEGKGMARRKRLLSSRSVWVVRVGVWLVCDTHAFRRSRRNATEVAFGTGGHLVSHLGSHEPLSNLRNTTYVMFRCQITHSPHSAQKERTARPFEYTFALLPCFRSSSSLYAKESRSSTFHLTQCLLAAA